MSHLLLIASALGAMVLAAAIAPAPNAALTTLVLFLGVLPLVNALLDFVSVGLTRLLVRAGTRHRRWAIPFALADIAAALGFFTLLGGTLIVTVHAMNAAAGATLVDLRALLDAIRNPETRGEYWWLYATLFSTIVPTLVHAAVATCSLVAWLPEGLRLSVRDRLVHRRHARTHAELGAPLALAAMATFASVLPLFLCLWGAQALITWHPEILGNYLAMFEGLVAWLTRAWPVT